MGSARQPCASGAGDPFAPHEGLARARSSSEGRDWLERLPSLVAESAAEWSLELGDPFRRLRVARASGHAPDAGDAVLKVCFPHRESEHVAVAPGRWDGERGCPAVAHSPSAGRSSSVDADRHGIERTGAERGSGRWRFSPRPVTVEEPFRPLVDEARWWAPTCLDRWTTPAGPSSGPCWTRPSQPWPHKRRPRASRCSCTRISTPAMSSGPSGSPGSSSIRSRSSGSESSACAPRPSPRARTLGTRRAPPPRPPDGRARPRSRARQAWSLAQTVAWCFGNDYFEQHVETARWLARA